MPSGKRSAAAKQAVIALDLGGTKLASALFDADGNQIVKRSLPPGPESYGDACYPLSPE